MSNCANIVALLSEYVDSDLPAHTCAVIQNHLEICPHCRETAEGLRRTVELCREYAPHDHPRPLPEERQQELREAFERVMTHMRHK